MPILSRKPGGTGGGGGGPPSGAAGGDLTGTYPNPDIAANVVGANEINGADAAAIRTELDVPSNAQAVLDTIVDAKGDLIVATAADTVARKAVGATNGMHLEAQSGQGDGLLWTLPPGAELVYVEATSGVTISGTNFAGAQTVVSAGAVTYDGTAVMIEFYSPTIEPNAAAGSIVQLGVSVDGSDIGKTWYAQKDASASADRGVTGCLFRRKYTPSAGSRTILVYGFQTGGNGTVNAGAGGAGNFVPAYIRITKA